MHLKQSVDGQSVGEEEVVIDLGLHFLHLRVHQNSVRSRQAEDLVAGS